MPEYQGIRILVAKLGLDLARSATSEYFPRMSIEESLPLVVIGRVLLTAGRPLTASEIARRTRMARGTVLRRLSTIMDMGMVIREGRFYRVDQWGLERYRPERLMQTVALIRAVCRELDEELSKMDKKD